jgi:hypothetical protein
MFQFSIATETGWAVEPVILSSVINASPKARLTLPPTALASSRSEPIDLSGQWSWKGAWRAGDALPEESNTGWFSIQIPSEYEQKGMKVDQKAALYRTCVVPEAWRGNRVKMRFDAVNNAMTLRINGVEVGKHDGFLLPFEFDVTDHLRFGSTNQILVELVELASEPGCRRGFGREALSARSACLPSLQSTSPNAIPRPSSTRSSATRN